MSRRRGLTPEERALWRRVARAVRPLRPGAETDDAAAGDVPVAAASKRPARAQSKAAISPLARRATAAPVVADPFAAGDPKAERHIRRGRKAIDAVFDLHGHTQSSARAALYGFLLEARSRGYGCVLIITGKGVRPDGSRSGLGTGVLRARFRDWVRDHDFGQHITRVSPAHQRHGGDGAFYVFLKRNKMQRNSD